MLSFIFISYFPVPEKGREEKKSNFDYVPVIAGVIAALALIIIVIVIVVIWKRRYGALVYIMIMKVILTHIHTHTMPHTPHQY